MVIFYILGPSEGNQVYNGPSLLRVVYTLSLNIANVPEHGLFAALCSVALELKLCEESHIKRYEKGETSST